jgi:hypothetical protein
VIVVEAQSWHPWQRSGSQRVVADVRARRILDQNPHRKSGNQASFIPPPLRHVLPAREGEHHSRLSLRHGCAIDNDILSGCFWQPNSAQQPTPFAAATSGTPVTNDSCSCAPYLWPCLPIMDVKQCWYLISRYAAVRATFPFGSMDNNAGLGESLQPIRTAESAYVGLLIDECARGSVLIRRNICATWPSASMECRASPVERWGTIWGI